MYVKCLIHVSVIPKKHSTIISKIVTLNINHKSMSQNPGTSTLGTLQ